MIVIATDLGGNGSSQIVGITVTDVPEASITSTKTMSMVSSGIFPFDCLLDSPETEIGGAIPGACVEYRITINNAATGSHQAEDIVVTDNLPEGVRAMSAGNISGFDGVTLTGDTVTGYIAVMPPGASAEFFIRALIE